MKNEVALIRKLDHLPDLRSLSNSVTMETSAAGNLDDDETDHFISIRRVWSTLCLEKNPIYFVVVPSLSHSSFLFLYFSSFLNVVVVVVVAAAGVHFFAGLTMSV